jgi:hypothetical protein
LEFGTLRKIHATDRKSVGIVESDIGRLTVSKKHGEAPSPCPSVAGSKLSRLDSNAMHCKGDLMRNLEIPERTNFLLDRELGKQSAATGVHNR